MWPLKTVEGRTRQKRRRLWWVGEGQGRGGCCAYCTWNVMVSWWWDRDLIVNLRKVRAWTMKEEWHTTEIDEKNRTKEFPGNASGNPPFFFFPASLQVGKQSSSCKWADKFRRQACAKKKREHERKPLVACDKLVLAQFLFFFASQVTKHLSYKQKPPRRSSHSAPFFLNGTSRWWEHKKISYPFCTTIRQMRERAKTRVRKRKEECFHFRTLVKKRAKQ